MSIKHAFISTKDDGADTTLVRPSDWNADHTGIDNLALLITYTQTEANLADAVAKKHNEAHTLASHSSKSHTELTDIGTNTHPQIDTAIAAIKGYAINVQALTSSPTDGQTVYFGNLPKAPTTTANISKIYIRKAGTIKIAEIYCYSGTAGTNEAWSLYIRKNNTTDYLIATVSAVTSERVFSNTGLSIDVAVGDYIEIKGVQPTWSTNPLTTIYGGYIYIE